MGLNLVPVHCNRESRNVVIDTLEIVKGFRLYQRWLSVWAWERAENPLRAVVIILALI